MLHFRGRLGVGGAVSVSEGGGGVLRCSLLAAEVDGLGTFGFGHVRSAANVDEQCARICSYRYHCLLASNPGIGVEAGLVKQAWWSATMMYQHYVLG